MIRLILCLILFSGTAIAQEPRSNKLSILTVDDKIINPIIFNRNHLSILAPKSQISRPIAVVLWKMSVKETRILLGLSRIKMGELLDPIYPLHEAFIADVEENMEIAPPEFYQRLWNRNLYSRLAGRRFKALHEASRIRLEELSEKTGYESEEIQKWEEGKIVPPVEALQQMTKVYQIEGGFLLKQMAELLCLSPSALGRKLLPGNPIPQDIVTDWQNGEEIVPIDVLEAVKEMYERAYFFTDEGSNVSRAFQMMREILGLPQHEIARWLGVNQPTISRWELGREVIPDSAFMELAGAYSQAANLQFVDFLKYLNKTTQEIVRYFNLDEQNGASDLVKEWEKEQIVVPVRILHRIREWYGQEAGSIVGRLMTALGFSDRELSARLGSDDISRSIGHWREGMIRAPERALAGIYGLAREKMVKMRWAVRMSPGEFRRWIEPASINAPTIEDIEAGRHYIAAERLQRAVNLYKEEARRRFNAIVDFLGISQEEVHTVFRLRERYSKEQVQNWIRGRTQIPEEVLYEMGRLAADKLQRMRQALGQSEQEFAIGIGGNVDLKQIERWERGNDFIPVDILAKTEQLYWDKSSEMLLTIRELFGLSQGEMEQELGVSKQMKVFFWENKRQKIPENTLIQIRGLLLKKGPGRLKGIRIALGFSQEEFVALQGFRLLRTDSDVLKRIEQGESPIIEEILSAAERIYLEKAPKQLLRWREALELDRDETSEILKVDGRLFGWEIGDRRVPEQEMNRIKDFYQQQGRSRIQQARLALHRSEEEFGVRLNPGISPVLVDVVERAKELYRTESRNRLIEFRSLLGLTREEVAEQWQLEYDASYLRRWEAYEVRIPEEVMHEIERLYREIAKIKFREMREAMNKSQKEIGELLDTEEPVDEETIKKWEAGDERIPEKMLRALQSLYQQEGQRRVAMVHTSLNVSGPRIGTRLGMDRNRVADFESGKTRIPEPLMPQLDALYRQESSARLKEMREALGLSAGELGYLLEPDNPMIAEQIEGYENGKLYLTVEMLERIDHQVYRKESIEQFKYIRESLGLSQEAMGKKLGMSEGSVWAWEMGGRRIPESILRQAKTLHQETIGKRVEERREALGLTPGELVGSLKIRERITAKQIKEIEQGRLFLNKEVFDAIEVCYRRESVKKLIRTRGLLKLSKEELAELLELESRSPYAYVKRWETGKVRIPESEMVKLEKLYRQKAGKRMEMLRELLGKSIEEVASSLTSDKVITSPEQVNRWEAGEDRVPEEILQSANDLYQKESGSVVRQIRMSNGLTQPQLAELIGYAVGSVAAWERGVETILESTLSRIRELMSEQQDPSGFAQDREICISL